LAYVIAVQENANTNRAAILGLASDIPEARRTDVPWVSKKYVKTADSVEVVGDQIHNFPLILAQHIIDLIREHEKLQDTRSNLGIAG
jgi:putative hydrolase of HD superfamily